MSSFQASSVVRRAPVLITVAALSGWSLGCAGSSPPESPAAQAREEASVAPTEAAPTGPASVPPAGDPPGAQAEAEAEAEDPVELGEDVHFDDQDRAYRELRVPKEEGRYKRHEDGRVQLPYGLLFSVAREDEEHFFMKLFVNPDELADLPVAASGPPPGGDVPSQPAYGTPLVVAPETDRLRFVSFDRGLPNRGQWRHGFELADVNGDGFLDIVHGPPRKGAQWPQIFLGDGEGGWQIWQEARFPDIDLDYGDVAVADFNGDGVPDLALAVHLRGIVAMVGDGEGGFRLWSEGLEYASPQRHQGTASFSSRAIVSFDWNGDGRIDLLTLGEGPQLGVVSVGGPGADPQFQTGSRGPAIFLNQGDGSWRTVRQQEAGRQPFGDSLAVGDFDGDGIQDFATASNSYGQVGIVHLGQPDGSWRVEQVEALGDSTLVQAVGVADVDGDGRDELVVGIISFDEDAGFVTGLELLDRVPDGTWSRRTLMSQQGQMGVSAVAAGDLDGDGYRDLVGATGAGELWILLGTATGDFLHQVAADVEPPDYYCRGYRVALVDLDGDGRDEIVAAFAGEVGSEQMIPGLRKHCPSEGALKVWRPVPAE